MTTETIKLSESELRFVKNFKEINFDEFYHIWRNPKNELYEIKSTYLCDEDSYEELSSGYVIEYDEEYSKKPSKEILESAFNIFTGYCKWKDNSGKGLYFPYELYERILKSDKLDIIVIYYKSKFYLKNKQCLS